jgi:hypothetical protein
MSAEMFPVRSFLERSDAEAALRILEASVFWFSGNRRFADLTKLLLRHGGWLVWRRVFGGLCPPSSPRGASSAGTSSKTVLTPPLITPIEASTLLSIADRDQNPAPPPRFP